MKLWVSVPLAVVAAMAMSEKGKDTDMLSAKVTKAIMASEVPGQVVVLVAVHNNSQERKDLISVIQEGKGSDVFLVSPIVAKWYKEDKVIEREVSLLQQTTTLLPGESAELHLLLKRPERSGQYRLVLAMEPLYGGGNDVVPAGFHCEAKVDCTERETRLLQDLSQSADSSRVNAKDRRDPKTPKE